MKVTSDNSPGEQQFSDWGIFTRIWISPRQVFKFINDYRYDKYVIVLLLLAGIAKTFERASSNNYGDTKELTEIVLTSVVVGGLFGWITYYIFAGIISWTGKWFNGQGDTSSILRILSYAMIPSVIVLIMLVIRILLSGNEVFTSPEERDADLNIVIGSYFLAFIYILPAFWSIVLVVVGISEVQKLSIGKSILNLLTASLIFLSPFILIGGLLAVIM